MKRLLGTLLLTLIFAAPGACDKAGPSPDAPTSAPPSVAGDGPSVALKGKVRTLAVAAECMRKQGLTSEKMTAAMRTMYQSLGVDLATYGETMGALSDDAAFQKSVAEGIAACPDGDTPVVVADAGVAAPDTVIVAVEADTTSVEAPTADTIVVAAADTAMGGVIEENDAGGAVEVANDDDALGPDEDGFAGDEDTEAGDPAPVKDAGIATPPPTAPDYDGLYRGTASGGGEIRISIAGGRVTSGYAILAGKRLALKGALKTNRVVLAGNANKRKASVHGKVDPVAGTISGTWTGLFDGRKKTGTFSAKR